MGCPACWESIQLKVMQKRLGLFKIECLMSGLCRESVELKIMQKGSGTLKLRVSRACWESVTCFLRRCVHTIQDKTLCINFPFFCALILLHCDFSIVDPFFITSNQGHIYGEMWKHIPHWSIISSKSSI